jgi:hypothetical protein
MFKKKDNVGEVPQVATNKSDRKITAQNDWLWRKPSPIKSRLAKSWGMRTSPECNHGGPAACQPARAPTPTDPSPDPSGPAAAAACSGHKATPSSGPEPDRAHREFRRLPAVGTGGAKGARPRGSAGREPDNSSTGTRPLQPLTSKPAEVPHRPALILPQRHFRKLSRNPGGLKALWSAHTGDTGTSILWAVRGALSSSHVLAAVAVREHSEK